LFVEIQPQTGVLMGGETRQLIWNGRGWNRKGDYYKDQITSEWA
jgi:hypothetical protein